MSDRTILLRPRAYPAGLILQAIDSAIIAGVLWATSSIFYTFDLHYLVASVAVALGFLILANQSALYHHDPGRSIASVTVRLLQVWATVILLAVLVAFVSKTSELFSRAAVLSWAVLTPCLMTLTRVVIRLYITVRGKSRGFTERAVIVGLNPTALQLVNIVQSRPELGVVFEGIYAAPEDRRDLMLADLGVEILGDIAQLPFDTRVARYDSVYIASIHDEARLRALIHELADCQVQLKYIPDIFTFNLLNSRISDIGGVPCIDVYDSPLDGTGALLKRLEDLILGVAIVVLIAVPMLLIACSIKLTSTGPVIFRQRRYGLNGEEFLVWKFRTMTVCEEGAEAVQARKNDPRVTAVGRFLRKTSLDELPQFLNVLGGSMSIVGPRPHPVALNEQFRREIEGYMLRHKVKPGITGWAQVNGWRGQTESHEKMEKRVQHDLHYIRNWSLWFDLRIIAITVIKGFGGQNAY